MSDDFLDDLRRNWREQDTEVELVAHRLRRGLMVSRAMLWLETATCVFAFLFGLFALWLGIWERPNGIVVIAGLSMVLYAPPAGWLAWRTRRAEPKWQDETAEGVLRGMIERTRTTEKLMRLVRWQGWWLIGLAAVMWAAAPTGWVGADRRLALVTGIFLASALIAFAWAVWRTRGARRERARCETLLREWQH